MQLLQITLDQQVEVISWRFETCTGALFAMQWTSSHCIVLRKGLFPRVVTSAGNMEELPVHVKIRYTEPWEHLKLPMTSEDWKFNNNVIQLNPVQRLKPPWNTGMKSQTLKNGEKKTFFFNVIRQKSTTHHVSAIFTAVKTQRTQLQAHLRIKLSLLDSWKCQVSKDVMTLKEQTLMR